MEGGGHSHVAKRAGQPASHSHSNPFGAQDAPPVVPGPQISNPFDALTDSTAADALNVADAAEEAADLAARLMRELEADLA